MSVRHQQVVLTVSDGTTMGAYVTMPDDSAVHPGIIVFQEAFGVNSHIRNICDRLAEAGYVSIAPEMFHRTAAAGSEFSYTDFDAIRPHSSAMTVEGQTADAHAAYDWLRNQNNVEQGKIGTIGFCMGGRFSFLANLILPVQVSVSY
ncbi:MAG TPA: dienelactone hydrolase family protein, partial [Candidatus Kapabacteria bacterium]|nr:dienelactone hydrolase family protein [Candidatus Kapabacteria bacterium]